MNNQYEHVYKHSYLSSANKTQWADNSDASFPRLLSVVRRAQLGDK